MIDTTTAQARTGSSYGLGGIALLFLNIVVAAYVFSEALDALFVAWQLPEYSHGPLIPVLSALLFLRHLKTEDVHLEPVTDYGPGLALLLLSLAMVTIGKLSRIDDIVAYALILWVGALLLLSFGWRQGRKFWAPVLHLVYMLPLPGLLYFKLSTFLQGVSSELGVWFLKLLDIPVFLEGNIIDLGVYKLHVAEACSGLRYLFPILSFSYIFAVLYRGPWWHKAILLISAAPITVVMNSVRIAIAGIITDKLGLEHLEGFSHFFEGWVIFGTCVVLLFFLAWLLLFLHPQRLSLTTALDLDTSGIAKQMARIKFAQPSMGMVIATGLMVVVSVAWYFSPQVEKVAVDRSPFVLYPTRLGDWVSSPPVLLDAAVEESLGADDYHSVVFRNPDERTYVDFFAAWYDDQSDGGTHSPEVCLPGAGWEIAKLERIDISERLPVEADYNINRAIIQKGEARMLVYYWFEMHGRHVAWDFAAKFFLLVDGVRLGRTDGALVRLFTPIGPAETEFEAEERLQSMFLETVAVLPEFIPPE